MEPHKKPSKDRVGVIGLSIASGLAIISAISFYVSSQTGKPMPKATPKETILACPADYRGYRNKPADLRGTTQLLQWRSFDQRFNLRPYRPESISVPAFLGSQVLSFKIKRKEAKAYDIGLSMINQRKIVRGETVAADVWLRGSALDGSNTPVVIIAKIQDNDGFRRLNEDPLTLSRNFTRHRIVATTSREYCPGELNFALHLATGAQQVDVGVGTLTVLSQP